MGVQPQMRSFCPDIIKLLMPFLVPLQAKRVGQGVLSPSLLLVKAESASVLNALL